MKISQLVWSEDRIDHIWRHQVELEEFEDVCFQRSHPALVLRAKSSGENPVYYVLGQSLTGRYLFCVAIHFPDGKGYLVTARPMPDEERRRFERWRRR